MFFFSKFPNEIIGPIGDRPALKFPGRHGSLYRW